ncbi:type II toxin-antitoxin system HicB family antitoxin [Paenibacillus vini]|uniref:type II toxin-antitoxin system HicB family antitoxin n=1 Tax=Paenibacillus vini TaxID=1476024 RepID=UPI0025B725DB|nr:type II toxin-antitoxin system HicB family antitoxin [Paenibacillus vini]MDN4067652.1 type II toxin-antitoxin system HicB family antitoxin [Paenibacillus vini]
MQDIKFQVLFEIDQSEKNVTAYIPALRLGAKGDTIEEARENALDLIEMEYEAALSQGRQIPQHTAFMEVLTMPAKKTINI